MNPSDYNNQYDPNTTLTIKVSIVSVDGRHGNAEFTLNVPFRHFRYINQDSLADDFLNTLASAMQNYNKDKEQTK